MRVPGCVDLLDQASFQERRHDEPVVAPERMERDMPNDDARNVDRAWELMKKIGFAMLATRDGEKSGPVR
jgi:hypothetical protein